MLQYNASFKKTSSVSNLVPNYNIDLVKEERKNNQFHGIFRAEKIKYQILGAYSVQNETKKGIREDLILELKTNQGFIKYKANGAINTPDGQVIVTNSALDTNCFLGLAIHKNPKALEPVTIRDVMMFDQTQDQTWYPNLIGMQGVAIATTNRYWEINGMAGYSHKLRFFGDDWRSLSEIEDNAKKAIDYQDTLDEFKSIYLKFIDDSKRQGFNPEETENEAPRTKVEYGSFTDVTPSTKTSIYDKDDQLDPEDIPF